jgi:hypothetical protein
MIPYAPSQRQGQRYGSSGRHACAHPKFLLRSDGQGDSRTVPTGRTNLTHRFHCAPRGHGVGGKRETRLNAGRSSSEEASENDGTSGALPGGWQGTLDRSHLGLWMRKAKLPRRSCQCRNCNSLLPIRLRFWPEPREHSVAGSGAGRGRRAGPLRVDLAKPRPGTVACRHFPGPGCIAARDRTSTAGSSCPPPHAQPCRN